MWKWSHLRPDKPRRVCTCLQVWYELVITIKYTGHRTDHVTFTTLIYQSNDASVSHSVCRKDQCSITRPSCPAHKKLSIKQTDCCDSYECVCNCQNSTRVCPLGFITKELTNECGCVDVTCLPDKVSKNSKGLKKVK